MSIDLSNRASVQELANRFRRDLLEDVIPFWLNHGVDHQHGGLYSGLDRDGNVIDTDKAVWPQCRFAWMLGELFNNVEKNPAWLETAERTLSFVSRFGFDPADGRMWFHLTQDGRPIRKRRYAFTESFAAIAYGELARATGCEEHFQTSINCFEQFVSHSLKPSEVVPKFTDVRPSKSIGFPMIAIATAQELRQSIDFDGADHWIQRGIDEIREDFVKPNQQCVMETVGTDGQIINHFDGRTLNPGHAIEAAWFIMREGDHRDDPTLVELGCQMLKWMLERGWDTEFGGLRYFVDVDGHPVQEYWHDMKFWWPHNEAIIATLMAYQLTGNKNYADWFERVFQWTHERFPDRVHGEWFGYLHRDGTVSTSLKGNLWKGPFHIPRMQLICWKICEALAR